MKLINRLYMKDSLLRGWGCMNIIKKIFKKNKPSNSNINMDKGEITMLTAQNLAKYIITKCTLDNKSVSNLQLQKILYFIQGAYYYKFKQPAFDNEISAWDYGPIVRDVYEDYKKYGSSEINDVYVDFEKIFENDNDAKKIVEIVVETLRDRDPWDLVRISHEGETPWTETYQIWGPTIQSIQIENYFKDNHEIFKKLGIEFNKDPEGTDTESVESKEVLKFFTNINKIKEKYKDQK